jgi:hypothetical protein
MSLREGPMDDGNAEGCGQSALFAVLKCGGNRSSFQIVLAGRSSQVAS